MDNRSFDDKIKDKLESLSPRFDEKAWEQMSHLLDHVRFDPWFIKWKSGLWAAGLTLFTLINFWLFWNVRSDKNEISQLLQELQHSPKQTVIDTIKITQIVSDTVFISAAFERGNNDYGSQRYRDHWDHHNNLYASNATHPSSLIATEGGGTNVWNRNFSILNGDAFRSQNPFLRSLYSGFDDPGRDPNSEYDQINRSSVNLIEPVPFLSDYLSLNGDLIEINEKYQRKDSRKRRYNRNPLHINIGLASGMLIPDPDIGERFLSLKHSLFTEVELKRDLRLLSGVSFSKINYKLDEVDDDNFTDSDLQRYPGYLELENTPDEIQIENTTVQIPLYLRYHKSLNYNWGVFVGAGPTLDILVNQSFKYSFLEIENGEVIAFSEDRKFENPSLNIGSLSGSFGIEHAFSRRLSGQMEVNYQYGLGRLGAEKRSINSLGLGFGLFYSVK
ncbi:outer membrane beta-barrel protein [Fulvivirgaceae bacterium BMA10]|uniref:Outer membrane beta-barrel protein n=1 Tax=Splendidivirga corallicola TaxID=3051826 RepID=A0ABT8KK78_9BACT|nr:outer membrane beta-barrel protein [Fulvivirgaceae bacterium BMA10]